MFRLRVIMADTNNPCGHWERFVNFPFAPFPGMRVGAHKVKRVSVCGGNLDGKGETLVELKKTSIDAEVLRREGWEWQEVDYPAPMMVDAG